MKKIAAKVVLLMTFVCLLTAAGYSQQLILKADVPFDFIVGTKTFPAGEYYVSRISAQTLSLRGSNNSFLTTFITEPVMSSFSQSNPKLKFQAVGGQYVLTEIWPDGAASGYELFATKKVNYIAETPSGAEGQTATSTYVGK